MRTSLTWSQQCSSSPSKIQGMAGGHGLGGDCGHHIKAYGFSPFPHQRKFCTEGLLAQRALQVCMLGRTPHSKLYNHLWGLNDTTQGSSYLERLSKVSLKWGHCFNQNLHVHYYVWPHLEHAYMYSMPCPSYWSLHKHLWRLKWSLFNQNITH